MDDKHTITQEVGGTINPDFHHEKKVSVKAVTQQFLDYLCNESLFIEVWGRQKGKDSKKAIVRFTKYINNAEEFKNIVKNRENGHKHVLSPPLPTMFSKGFCGALMW